MSGLTPDPVVAEVRSLLAEKFWFGVDRARTERLLAHIDYLTAELERLRGPVAQAIPIDNGCVCGNCKAARA